MLFRFVSVILTNLVFPITIIQTSPQIEPVGNLKSTGNVYNWNDII